MKKCIFCKRSIMESSYIGMCPKCFNNFLQILFIIFMFLMINTVMGIVALLAVLPVSSILGPLSIIGVPAEVILDIAVVISALLGAIVGYGIVVFLIVRFIINNKKI